MSKIVRRAQVILDETKYQLTPEIAPQVDVEFEEDEDTGAEEKPSTAPSISEEDLQAMIDEAVEEARNLTQQASNEASEIIEAAYEQAKGIYEKSNLEGREEGYAAGFEEGRAQAEALVQEALSIKNTAIDQYKSLLENSEAEIVDLVLETVQTVLNKHIKEDEAVIEGLVRSALDKCAYTSNLVLRVASEDFGYALSMRDRILTLAESVDRIEIKEDKALSPGSCVIDTSAGSVDSSINMQFEQIRETFLSLLGSE